MFNFMRLPPLRRLMLMKAITGGGSWSTITGNPVSFTAKAAPLRQLKVAFSPVQDLHGYDSPWPAGGGANQWDEEWESGRFDLSTGALVADSNCYRSKNFIPTQGNTQYFAKSNTNVAVGCWDASKQYLGRVPSSFKDASFTTLANTAYIKFYSAASSYAGGTSINYPATVTTYSPYSNICPISGWDSLTVYHSGADTSNPQAISISLGSTVYSGTVDVVTGVVKARPYYASYNGETLVGPWMSSMDKYVAGATPTVGAQVVDLGGAETTVQLTPQQVSSLLGENNMWSDANGDLTVEYRSN